jgi:N-methylhydantoinase A
VLPEHREYERTSTTVANAYVSPVMTRYLSRLERGLEGHDVARVRVMSSNGGSISAESAGRLAVQTAVSGPAGGVAGAFALAARAGYERILTLDMGGTSTDVSLCPGRILERDETSVGGLPIRGATVDVLSVGAGGGSIARVDAGGALRVGPESAGAEPGPACYGRGESPTVTDAQVALGRITPEYFLGGRMVIRPELSLKALGSIADAFGGDARRAAAAVLKVANANMEAALRVVSVERGHDPREFTLVAFGGAGPLHACELAGALRVPRVIVPPHPGVLSALGMATAPIVKELAASVMVRLEGSASGCHIERLRRVRDELEARGRSELKSEKFALRRLRVETILDMRYAGQSFELPVTGRSLRPERFLKAFHRAHQERYGHSDTTRVVEVVNMRVKLILPAGGPTVSPLAGDKERLRKYTPKPVERREVWFGDGSTGPVSTPFFERSALAPGAWLQGPAVVTQMDCTTVLPPGWSAQVDGFRNIVMQPARRR